MVVVAVIAVCAGCLLAPMVWLYWASPNSYNQPPTPRNIRLSDLEEPTRPPVDLSATICEPHPEVFAEDGTKLVIEIENGVPKINGSCRILKRKSTLEDVERILGKADSVTDLGLYNLHKYHELGIAIGMNKSQNWVTYFDVYFQPGGFASLQNTFRGEMTCGELRIDTNTAKDDFNAYADKVAWHSFGDEVSKTGYSVWFPDGQLSIENNAAGKIRWIRF